MNKPCGVYVRAQSPSGSFWAAPIEKLTEDSWRAWVCWTVTKVKSVGSQLAGMPELHTTCEPDRPEASARVAGAEDDGS